MNGTAQSRMAELLRETGKAHHEAFLATDGEDPEWPIWYAYHLHPRMSSILPRQLTKSRLVHCLVAADDEHRARDSETDWPEAFARILVERCGSEPTPAAKLALYHFEGCPFCALVRRAIDRLGVEVEMRDIFREAEHRAGLIEARGRATVPVLRVTAADGSEVWMPESADIVDWLEATYGTAED